MSTLYEGRVGNLAGRRIGDVPQDAEIRAKIRQEAGRLVRDVSRASPLSRDRLEDIGSRVLNANGLGERYLGFAMVAASNAFWREQFEATPFDERLILLPHCLRDQDRCKGDYSPLGLTCEGCGACVLPDLQAEAEKLGYKVLIAEGTPAVVQVVLSGRASAVLGVACLDSLREAFQSIFQLGIPNVAVPLLKDGCVNTVAELDVLRDWMHSSREPAGARTRSYMPLLRAANSLFEEDTLRHFMGDGGPAEDGALTHVESLAFDWMRRGGKRFRPFVTLASYAALTRGRRVLEPDAELRDDFPDCVRGAAVAIEALHKASLAHDDIEDGDDYRYGEETLHRQHGVGTALNVGDHLVGLGYKLVSSVKREAGPDCAADILSHLSDAHLKLTRGQGAELLWQRDASSEFDAGDVQSVYALKTAPAFEAAMYAGLRLAVAGADTDGAAPERAEFAGGPPEAVQRFCRYLGAAYQVMNDLDDWDGDGANKIIAGQDALTGRPTMLKAFALGAADDEMAEELKGLASAELSEDEKLNRVREIYEDLGVFEKACRLVQKYRQKALDEADAVRWENLGELMRFIVETVL